MLYAPRCVICGRRPRKCPHRLRDFFGWKDDDMTEIHGLRDIVGPLFDEALHQAAPNDDLAWDYTWQLAPDQRTGQMSVGCVLVLTGPSPLLGGGSLTSWAVVEMGNIKTVEDALVPIRALVERNRAARARVLKMN